MTNETELGKGLFGYRKSAVNQIMSDRDQMLRQAEGRVRAAESKVAELESELVAMRDHTSRADQQLERLRHQLDEFMARSAQPAQVAAPVWTEPQTPEADVSPAPAVFEAVETTPHAPLAAVVEPVTADEPAMPDSTWEENSAWTEADPAGDPTSQQHEESDGSPEISYAPDDRYGYGQVEALDSVEATPDPASPEQAWDGWATEPEPFDAPSSDPQGFDVAYEPQIDPAEPTMAEYQQEQAPEAHFEVPVAAVQDEPAREESAPRVDDLTQRFLNDELAQILRAAEESASRIVERARSTTDQEIEESNRLWNQVQAEVARFAAWREDVEPVIQAVQSKVDEVRTYIDEVPERIRQALAPVAESISSIDADLADLASRATPPLLLTPAGVAGSQELDESSDGEDVDHEPGSIDPDAFGWNAEAAPVEEQGTEADDASPVEEPRDEQEYDVPFGEGWTEMVDRPYDDGSDHSFGASAS